MRRIDTTTGDEQVFAGGGTSRGDGGPASAAKLENPAGIAVDRAGNVFIADWIDHRVRKVDPAGTISTVAGGGTPNTTNAKGNGDGGPATAAYVRSPHGLALSAAGDLFITDTGDQLVRKVNTSGTINTVAGGTDVFADGVPATASKLKNPRAVTVDPSGSLFIADAGHNLVRKVDAKGIITTVAGDSTYAHAVTNINRSTTLAGDGGPATRAQLNHPSGVAVVAGNLLIADTNNHRIRRVDAEGVITTLAGSGDTGFDQNSYRSRGGYGGDGGPAGSARLDQPSAVALSALGNVLIADTFNYRVRMVGEGGTIDTMAGTGFPGGGGDGQPATEANLSAVSDVLSDGAGNVLVADVANHRIRKIDAGGIISTVAGNGMAGFDGSGSMSEDGDGGPASSARLNRPSALALGPSGALYVAQRHRVRKVDASGIFVNAGGAAHRPTLLPLAEHLPSIDDQLRGAVRQIIPPFAGITTRKPGTSGTIAVDLVPGHRYAFICVALAADGRSHALQGMSSEFRTSGQRSEAGPPE